MLTGLPLWKWERAGRPRPARDDVREPCIPNRFLAEVDLGEKAAWELAEAARNECELAWKEEIAGRVWKFLSDHTGDGTLDPYGLWPQQIKEYFEITTAVLQHDQYDPDRIEMLLGPPPDGTPVTPWSRRHQVAQKMLAAVKNRRHFPEYAPDFKGGKVPQKDTLLGTFEHLGPAERDKAREFWENAAERDEDGGWDDRGSKVNDGERLARSAW